MEYFLHTEEVIPDGLGFKSFDLTHLLWLLVTVLLIVLAALHYRRLDENGRGKWRKVVAILLIADELFKQICLIIGGNFLVKYLPLHLCSINIFLIAYHAWKPNMQLGSYLYAVCIPGALAAILCPTWTQLPVLNFMHLHSTTVHILLLMYPVVLTAGGDIKPRAKQIPKCLLVLAFLAAVALCANLLLDTNFFFLMEAGGENNPLYLFELLLGDHRFGFPILIAAVLAVMFIPVEVYHKLKKDK